MPPEDPKIALLSKGKPYLKITNLHPDLSEHDIGDLFLKVGEVSFVYILVDTAGQSKGIAYVGYEDPRNGKEAIARFDGKKAAGYIISVSNGVPLASRIGAGSKSHRRSKGRGRERREKGKASVKETKTTIEDLDKELEAYKEGKDGDIEMS